MTDGPSDNNQQQPYAGDCEFTQFLLKKAADRSPEEASNYSRDILAKAREIKLLLLDVDGVLTNGSITYSSAGDEIKSFHCRDGFGMNMLKKIGVTVGLITARKSLAVERRALDLSLTHVYQGARNKVKVFREVVAELGITPLQSAFVGDDWLDLPLLAKVGLAAAVGDASPEVKEIAHFVTQNRGGNGAVREVCDLIIEARGMRRALLKQYMERQ